MAMLAKAAYANGKTKIGQWKQVECLAPKNKETVRAWDGFRAVIFQHQKTGEFVISFAGTNPKSPLDIKTDVLQALGLRARQFEIAILLTKTFLRSKIGRLKEEKAPRRGEHAPKRERINPFLGQI